MTSCVLSSPAARHVIVSKSHCPRVHKLMRIKLETISLLLVTVATTSNHLSYLQSQPIQVTAAREQAINKRLTWRWRNQSTRQPRFCSPLDHLSYHGMVGKKELMGKKDNVFNNGLYIQARAPSNLATQRLISRPSVQPLAFTDILRLEIPMLGF